MKKPMRELSEREYCLSIFEEKFRWLKQERIALYGTGINAKAILEQFSEYNVVCLVDDKKCGQYVGNHYVASFDEFLELEIDKIIIAARIESALAVFKRIGGVCMKEHIAVYDMYGNNMQNLRKKALLEKIQYPQITYKDLCREIDNHDVISIDLDNTLVSSKYLFTPDELFYDVERKINQAGVNINQFAKKLLDIHKANGWIPLDKLCAEICNSERLSEEDTVAVISAMKKITIEQFVKRECVWEAMKYASIQGKKICIIADIQDCQIPELWVKEILKNNTVNCVDSVICSSTYHMNKCTGLYRILKELYGEARYMHIGDQEMADYLGAQFYGIDAFRLFGPFDYSHMFGEIILNQGMLGDAEIRSAYEEYVMAVYNDVCFVNDFKGMNEETKYLEQKVKALRDRYLQGEEKITFKPVLLDEVAIKDNVDQYEKLEFKTYSAPLVSIIIPVYNQFDYTFNCLKSVLLYSGNVEYEVIIADDCSTDQTSELEKAASGITVIHNTKNLKFLLNCNNAAQKAKGKYILFLNNDTQVQPGWLEPLVKVMEQYEEAGMVGSRLVYPDGYLQEAGGILWRDGSAWNWGQMKNPDGPEYCYMKEADYVSGASVMIRAELWKVIGGFDENYAPAYYEDTDLAFEVRKKGFKVFLQPASVVVHFEGRSNGTDVATGLKAYQVINQQKFYNKWKDVLQKEHFPNGQNVYLAKDRGQFKKQILVVDHYVPNYDKDAGGRCTYMYIKMFLRMGFKVTFIGDNFARPEPYTTELNAMGVEVLFGNYYHNNWESWLMDNLQYFDYIYLQRPHISVKYIDIVKKYARGKIFYFAHDLHHVRMYRDYLLTGDKRALEESQKWKEIEIDLFSKADVGHVVGSYEQEVMQKIFPDKPIRNIPLYIFDSLPVKVEKDFTKRKDILFVGGFGHAPNIDAVKWFADKVYPAILQQYPDMIWHIVGSKVPEEISQISSKNIILEGFLSDEELEGLYRRCRLAVVPLRYGAGVKGKVVEAAYYQIPLVTTAIGGEGLDTSTKAFVMEDDAKKMASLICNLYEDFSKLREMSDAGAEFINRYFTSKVAEDVLLEDMDIES